MQKSKYNSRKVVNEFGTFDSVRESSRYIVLRRLEEEGKISDLRRQIPFELIPKQKLETPRTKRGKRTQNTELAVKYYADFVYTKDGKQIVEDSKGMKTPEYVIKRKLMKYILGIEIVEV